VPDGLRPKCGLALCTLVFDFDFLLYFPENQINFKNA
jgi:hypothetical protein